MERVEFLMVATDRDVVVLQCVEVRSQLLPIIAKIGLVERRLVLNGLPIFVYKLPMLLDQMVVIRSYFGELVAEALVHQSNCNRRIEPTGALPHDSPTDDRRLLVFAEPESAASFRSVTANSVNDRACIRTNRGRVAIKA